ncbi:MAG: DUF3784 domain-containing protein [Ethanoligenens sp.]
MNPQIVLTILFVILGVVFMTGNGDFLIAGYNLKSEEEKKKYDKKSLTRFMGIVNFILACILFLSFIGSLLKLTCLPIITVILLVGIVAFVLYYLNTKKRFKK